MELKRIVIYSKDIERVTGRSGRAARKMITRIRQHLGKDKHHLISVKEFCVYTGLPEAEVMLFLYGYTQ